MAVADDMLDRHMAAFGKQDMEGVIADYAENAVMFTAGGAIRGHDALRQAFAGMFAEWGKPGTTFSLQQRIVDRVPRVHRVGGRDGRQSLRRGARCVHPRTRQDRRPLLRREDYTQDEVSRGTRT